MAIFTATFIFRSDNTLLKFKKINGSFHLKRYLSQRWKARPGQACTSAYDPPHDKTNKMACAPIKDSISLGIRTVWSESSLSTWRKLGSLATHWVHSEDWSDWVDAQADLSFAGCTCHFVGFVMRWLLSSPGPLLFAHTIQQGFVSGHKEWFYTCFLSENFLPKIGLGFKVGVSESFWNICPKTGGGSDAHPLWGPVHIKSSNQTKVTFSTLSVSVCGFQHFSESLAYLLLCPALCLVFQGPRTQSRTH